MIDGIIYLIGAAIALVGMLGIFALVTLWAVERVVDLTKLTAIITEWYIDKARRERDAKRTRG